jgi:3-deoxy-manno-octulosonate cytidylyltransferase (CMP-KDO synthetase)
MPQGFKVVIPARFASSRLPGKPLLPIAGKPMIVHVCERALAANPQEVVVATDHEGIVEAVAGLGVTALMTDTQHNSGTERIAEVAARLRWEPEQMVVNLQGDEPLMRPGLVQQLAEVLAEDREAQVGTLAVPIHRRDEVFNPNAVKVVLDCHGRALYFSRAPIPWHRDSFADGAPALPLPLNTPYLRHIGIYAYTVQFLKRYVTWKPSLLETVESLEQLRILWMGERIRVLTIDHAPEAGVDTEADLHRVRELMA